MPLLTVCLLCILLAIAAWNYTQLDTIYDELKLQEEKK